MKLNLFPAVRTLLLTFLGTILITFVSQAQPRAGAVQPLLAPIVSHLNPAEERGAETPTLSATANQRPPSALHYYGQVLDERQRPLPGACVFLPGNHHLMAVTNGQGEFTLDVPATAERLLVAYAGLSDRQILLKGESPTAAIVVRLTK